MDELDELQSKILSQLQDIEKKYGVKYYIASRNSDIILQNAPELAIKIYDIRRYNLEQIKHFLDAFFLAKKGKPIICSLLLEKIRLLISCLSHRLIFR